MSWDKFYDKTAISYGNLILKSLALDFIDALPMVKKYFRMIGISVKIKRF
ncbi:hypothetical protein [Leptospira santarosai]